MNCLTPRPAQGPHPRPLSHVWERVASLSEPGEGPDAIPETALENREF
jgi:hypothetical protein